MLILVKVSIVAELEYKCKFFLSRSSVFAMFYAKIILYWLWLLVNYFMSSAVLLVLHC